MREVLIPDASCLIVRDTRAADELRVYAHLTKPFIVHVGESVIGRRYDAILISRHTHSEMLSDERGHNWWFELMLCRLSIGGKVIYLD